MAGLKAGWVADVEQKARDRFFQRPLVLIEELQIRVTTAPNRNAGAVSYAMKPKSRHQSLWLVLTKR